MYKRKNMPEHNINTDLQRNPDLGKSFLQLVNERKINIIDAGYEVHDSGVTSSPNIQAVKVQLLTSYFLENIKNFLSGGIMTDSFSPDDRRIWKKRHEQELSLFEANRVAMNHLTFAYVGLEGISRELSESLSESQDAQALIARANAVVNEINSKKNRTTDYIFLHDDFAKSMNKTPADMEAGYNILPLYQYSQSKNLSPTEIQIRKPDNPEEINDVASRNEGTMVVVVQANDPASGYDREDINAKKALAEKATVLCIDILKFFNEDAVPKPITS